MSARCISPRPSCLRSAPVTCIRKRPHRVSHNAVLGGRVRLKLNGAGRVGPLVDTFLTASHCTFTFPLRPFVRTRLSSLGERRLHQQPSPFLLRHSASNGCKQFVVFPITNHDKDCEKLAIQRTVKALWKACGRITDGKAPIWRHHPFSGARDHRRFGLGGWPASVIGSSIIGSCTRKTVRPLADSAVTEP
jgi:hypothetical protein